MGTESKAESRTEPIYDGLALLVAQVRARLIARFPTVVRADVERKSRLDGSGVDAAMWTVQKLMRALVRIHGSGVTSADVAAVFSILLERAGEAERVSLVVRLAPWVTAELVREDMEDATSGGGVRCVAYALFTSLREREPRLHVVRHRGRWCLIVHAFYTSGRWVDVYVVPLSATRGEHVKRAVVTLHAGVRKVDLDMADHVLTARAHAVSKMDALFVAAHAMRASGATPIIPGSHVLSELRDVANAAHSEKLRDLLPLMQDPYEQAFTAYHTHLQAFARQGLVGGHMGAYYARNLITTLRLSGIASDLDVDEGPLCLIIKPHHDQHYRVANYERDVQHLVGSVDADVSDEVDEAMDALMDVIADIGKDGFVALRDAKRTRKLGVPPPPSEADSVAALMKEQSKWKQSAVDAAKEGGFVAGAATLATTAPMLFLGGGALLVGAGVVGGTVYGGYNLGKWLVRRARARETQRVYADFFSRLAKSGLTDASVAAVAPATHIAFHVLELARTSFPLGLANFQSYVYARLAIDVGTTEPSAVAAMYVEWVNAKKDELEFWRGGTTPAESEARLKDDPAVKQALCVRDAVARYRVMATGLPTLAGDYEPASDVYWLLVAYYDCVSRQCARNAGRMYDESAGRMMYGASDTVGLAFECGELLLGQREVARDAREPRGPREQRYYPLDAVPLGACVFAGADTAGEYMVWVRSGDRTFDAYSVRAYDTEVDLGNNRTVALAELVEHLARGDLELRGPLYAAMDVLDADRRNEAHIVVVRAVPPTCTFRPAAIMPELARARLDGVDRGTWEAYKRLCEGTEGVLRRNVRRMLQTVTSVSGATTLVATAGYAAATVNAGALTLAATAVGAIGALPIAAVGTLVGVSALCYYGADYGGDAAAYKLAGAMASVRASLRGLVRGKATSRLSSAAHAGLLPHVERYIKLNAADGESDAFKEVYDPMSLSAESMQVAQPAIRHATRLLVSTRSGRCTLTTKSTATSWSDLFPA